jgi:hypothetical protein
LVIRGEFLFDIRIFKRWERELRKANRNERGKALPLP